LLANAIKFTEHGEVALRIGRPQPGALFDRDDLRIDGTVAFAVSDTGVGIAPEHRVRVFAPFEQVEASSDRRYGGTGLGLSIARALAGLLGGELHLASTRGEGSTFTCFLPLEAAARGAKRATPEPVAAPSSATLVCDDRGVLRPGDDHLLVIEDDRVFAELLGAVIHAAGLRYVVECDGRSGLRAARERRPTGIILDVKLPDVDGWHIMEKLRADRSLASIPVHFVSGVEGADRGMLLGAVGYLEKPASRADLVRVVESLTPRRDRSSRILIVESAASRDATLAFELAAENVETHRVGSAREAFEVLEQQRFGCIILDLALPDMDGLELLESLRERCGDEMPSVVVYTSRPLSRAEATRLDSYADAVIVKDGSSSERLIDEIKLFLRRLKDGLGSRRAVGVERVHPADARLADKTVLLVDDDMRTAYALSAALRAKGVHVLVADTGHAAIATLSEHPDVAAVLMDIMMPEMDGYEATRRIRRDARFQALPIIALTAKAMKGDREKCIEAGASDYLPKPVDAARLLVMLNTWIAKTQTDEP
jgi:CheY-like chemotaxis protein